MASETSEQSQQIPAELAARLDHYDDMLHLILKTIQDIATPEAKAMLVRLTSNPALRWAARRNGDKP